MSIARYGDGEFKLCRGAAAKSQQYCELLGNSLLDILKNPPKNCLVGVPRISDLSFMVEQKQKFWGQYQKPQYVRMLNPSVNYASAFITRPDSVPKLDNMEYFDSVKSLWTGRRVVLINGDNKRFDKDPSILDNAASYRRWWCPSQNSFDLYPSFLDKCLTQDKETLFILGMGATATVLAAELSKHGYQALDLGHLGMFYARLTSR